MSEMPSKEEFSSRTPLGDNFCSLRNDYLDLFAELETVLFRVAKRAQVHLPESAPMHQRLEGLASAKPSHQLSKVSAEKLHELSAAIHCQLRIRNFIVHSVMSSGSNGPSKSAIFQNAVDRSLGFPFYLVMTADDFAKQFVLLNGFIKTCQLILNPPSSPPQP
jgi:hypothetical protein